MLTCPWLAQSKLRHHELLLSNLGRHLDHHVLLLTLAFLRDMLCLLLFQTLQYAFF